ncbi:Vesicle-associated membrane-protein-associated protein [Parasponia andersonii]|uniref:Vesicle-associated membrane-protein-associated protein n=1 Tax=Parasponia andersonii TaxID=3476 RepID=A0A2P5AVY1_PARAD|nr:Vesicle-associated membrane-protein-associated protein [Parasponia andersonii]
MVHEECKLRVVFVSPSQRPSLVVGGSKERSSQRGSVSENGKAKGAEFGTKVDEIIFITGDTQLPTSALVDQPKLRDKSSHLEA